MNIVNKIRAKITLGTILISIVVIVILWSCLFVTDYIMFNKGFHAIFCTTELITTDTGHATKEQGLGYCIYSESFGSEAIREFVLFGKKIK